MKAQSDVYIQLQNIYKKKAREDVAEVIKYVRSHPLGPEIDVQEVEAYCKNAAFVKLIRGNDMSSNNIRDLAGELLPSSPDTKLTCHQMPSSTLNMPLLRRSFQFT